MTADGRRLRTGRRTRCELNLKPAPELTIVETPRLRLRHIRKADLPALIALWTDPEVTRYMGGPRGETALSKVLSESTDDPFGEVYDLWPVEEKSSGEVVGQCGLLEKEIEGANEIELVYVIARSRWGMGYATEVAQALVAYAFDVRALKRLVSLIEPDNARSERVACKIWMRMEKEVHRPGGGRRRLYAIKPQRKDRPDAEAWGKQESNGRHSSVG